MIVIECLAIYEIELLLLFIYRIVIYNYSKQFLRRRVFSLFGTSEYKLTKKMFFNGFANLSFNRFAAIEYFYEQNE